MKTLSLLSLLILIASCGKAPEMKEPSHGKSYSPLEGKSATDVLRLKYNNQVSINCEIRVSNGQKDMFSWNVPGELSVMRILNYQLGSRSVVVVVRIAETMKIMEQVSHTGENRREYFMEHSPVIKIHYKRDSRKILADGTVHKRESYSDAVLYENVPVNLFTTTSETDEDELVTENFQCELKTTMNPQYKHQWTIVK